MPFENFTPARCRNLRTGKGLTQSTLASSAGISHASVISNFENGRLVLADWQVRRILEVLDPPTDGPAAPEGGDDD